jgi:Tfp pilus assembly protein PilO
MSIKRILFPLFIFVIAFLVVNYIRPSVLSVLDQRSAKEVKLAELSAAEKTAANIWALSDARTAFLNSGDGGAILSYLPIKPDHDRIVDVLNYLALQSGAVIGNISFENNATPSVLVPQQEIIGADGSVVQTPPQAPVPSAIFVSVGMNGTYDGLKSFMEKVSSMDRLRKIVSFSLSKEKQVAALGADGQVSPDDGILSAELGIELLYLPEVSYPNAHLLPIFATGSFDVDSVQRAMESDESVPPLPEPPLPERRADPFKL